MKADTTTLAPVPSRKRRFFRWMRYLLTVLVALVIALVCAGAIYEAIESRRDRRQYHPRGHDIQIDKPEAVVDAIHKVVGQAKGAATRRMQMLRPSVPRPIPQYSAHFSRVLTSASF
jgi:hypothetical protein